MFIDLFMYLILIFSFGVIAFTNCNCISVYLYFCCLFERKKKVEIKKKKEKIVKTCVRKNLRRRKKFYVHKIAAVILSKVYFLKNAKKTCKPNNRDLNRD